MPCRANPNHPPERTMKTRLPLLAVLVAATAASAAAPAPTAVTATFVDADAPEHAEIRNLGEHAINRLGYTLSNEVAVAVSKKGPEKAIEVCHLKALPLTGEIIAGMPRITAVKRTSLKLRNPANAPDEAEKQALERVEKGIEKGVLPKVLVQRIDRPEAKPEWRVYRPIGVAPQCVTCHGSRESMPAELSARLSELYPKDQASGYVAGQWRGLISVTVGDAPPPPPPPPPPAAKSTTTGKAAKKK